MRDRELEAIVDVTIVTFSIIFNALINQVNPFGDKPPLRHVVGIARFVRGWSFLAT